MFAIKSERIAPTAIKKNVSELFTYLDVQSLELGRFISVLILANDGPIGLNEKFGSKPGFLSQLVIVSILANLKYMILGDGFLPGM